MHFFDHELELDPDSGTELDQEKDDEDEQKVAVEQKVAIEASALHVVSDKEAHRDPRALAATPAVRGLRSRGRSAE